MNDLIKITKSNIGAEVINSVNAREIHSYLEVKTAFTTWFNRTVEKYDFTINEDFISFLKESNGGRPQQEHIVSLDMAKELCLVEPNEKGKETRKYFIEVEKRQNRVLTTSEQIILLAQGHQEIEQRLSNTEDKINYLENKSPIVYNQIKVLEDKRKSRTNQLVGYNPNCEKSKANYSRTIRALTKKFKDVFGVARYADLPKDKYNDALKWVSSVEMVDLI